MNYILPKKNTHKAYILFLLLSGHRFKNFDMWGQLNTGYSASRISELRSDGWKIKDQHHLHHSGNPLDKKVKLYYMDYQDIANALTDNQVIDFIQKMKALYKAQA